jgi:hypothetical protein
VEAAVHARKELGPGYDDEIVDSLLAKIEERLEQRPAAPARHTGPVTPMIISLAGCGVGATAILAGNGNAWLVPIVWIALAWAIREIMRHR